MSSAKNQLREPSFRIGDLVRLNSGGPRMMIVDVHANSVTAAWRDKDGHALERAFPISCVYRV